MATGPISAAVTAPVAIARAAIVLPVTARAVTVPISAVATARVAIVRAAIVLISAAATVRRGVTARRVIVRVATGLISAADRDEDQQARSKLDESFPGPHSESIALHWS